MSEIDYTQFGRAIERLREVIAERERSPENEFVRDAVVQRFEFTYELATVVMRRFLMDKALRHMEVREVTFPTLVRIGNEHGLLLGDWPRWHQYREARNTASHAYNEELARQVVDLAPAFLQEVDFLYRRIQELTP